MLIDTNILIGRENNHIMPLALQELLRTLSALKAEIFVHPYYAGNLNAAIQDLIRKALAEQDFVHSHITHIKAMNNI